MKISDQHKAIIAVVVVLALFFIAKDKNILDNLFAIAPTEKEESFQGLVFRSIVDSPLAAIITDYNQLSLQFKKKFSDELIFGCYGRGAAPGRADTECMLTSENYNFRNFNTLNISGSWIIGKGSIDGQYDERWHKSHNADALIEIGLTDGMCYTKGAPYTSELITCTGNKLILFQDAGSPPFSATLFNLKMKKINNDIEVSTFASGSIIQFTSNHLTITNPDTQIRTNTTTTISTSSLDQTKSWTLYVHVKNQDYDWGESSGHFTFNSIRINPSPIEDPDFDGISSSEDNCPDTFNVGQEDIDHDQLGDVCDIDMDGDGVVNNIDNCATIPNPTQLSCVLQQTSTLNASGIAANETVVQEILNQQASDKDSDNDGILDHKDNAPFISNADQKDTDGDGIGDVIDLDLDGDGILNAADNCIAISNPNQLNTDGDSMGDKCDDNININSTTTTKSQSQATSILSNVAKSNVLSKKVVSTNAGNIQSTGFFTQNSFISKNRLIIAVASWAILAFLFFFSKAKLSLGKLKRFFWNNKEGFIFYGAIGLVYALIAGFGFSSPTFTLTMAGAGIGGVIDQMIKKKGEIL